MSDGEGDCEKSSQDSPKYGIADEHIFNSRDSSFVQDIQRVIGGRGVDCVLNSLSDELLRILWNCLTTFGTFFETGMRDITDICASIFDPSGKAPPFLPSTYQLSSRETRLR